MHQSIPSIKDLLLGQNSCSPNPNPIIHSDSNLRSDRSLELLNCVHLGMNELSLSKPLIGQYQLILASDWL